MQKKNGGVIKKIMQKVIYYYQVPKLLTNYEMQYHNSLKSVLY